jgi:hypothetical protein
MRNGKVNGTLIFAKGIRVDHDLPVKSGLVDNPIAMSFLKRHDFSRAETCHQRRIKSTRGSRDQNRATTADLSSFSPQDESARGMEGVAGKGLLLYVP